MNKKEREEYELYEKMQEIEVFPGSLEEYERFKGGEKYKIIDIPGPYKFLKGGLRSFKKLKIEQSLLKKVFASEYATYHEIVREAVDLGASAIIRYSIIDIAAIRYTEIGIPVKKKF